MYIEGLKLRFQAQNTVVHCILHGCIEGQRPMAISCGLGQAKGIRHWYTGDSI